ncbi:MAG TPA: ABC transporter permease [Candidatus Dormibacteraeota bacterium]|nr:ABC transporter permease [Candidatus Dormibacteraeota bacterium]
MPTSRVLTFLAGRLAIVILAAFALSWTVFLLVHALPGSPYSGDERMTEARERLLLHRAHLDDPYPIQYVHWIQTFFTDKALSSTLLGEASISVRLGLIAITLTLAVGIWAGVASAANRGTRIDYVAGFLGSVAYAIPNFVWSIWLFFFFSVVLYRWTGGLFYVEVGWGQPMQWVVPAIALALPRTGFVTRIVRASVLETLGTDYVRTAWAKGLGEKVVLLRHALRNALLPLLTVMGPIAVTTLMGSLIVENVFDAPGLGSELVYSIFHRAYFIATGVFTYYSLLAGLAMLAVDVAYVFIDPRIRV